MGEGTRLDRDRNQDWQGFVVRLLDEGGFCLELDPCDSLGEALLALERRLPEVEE